MIWSTKDLSPKTGPESVNSFMKQQAVNRWMQFTLFTIEAWGIPKDVFFFFSIYTNTIDNWCKFERVIVSFDSLAGRWNCPCRSNRQTYRSIHWVMSMLWIFQQVPELQIRSPIWWHWGFGDGSTHDSSRSHSLYGHWVQLTENDRLYILKEKNTTATTSIRTKNQGKRTTTVFYSKWDGVSILPRTNATNFTKSSNNNNYVKKVFQLP